MNKAFAAAVAALSLTACAPQPAGNEILNAARSTATAQGGVCIGQDFRVLVGSRETADVRVEGIDKDGVPYATVFTQRSSKGFDFLQRGDAAYGENVRIQDIAIKPTDQCGPYSGKPAPAPRISRGGGRL